MPTKIYCEKEDCAFWHEGEPSGSCGSDEIEVGDDRRCYSFQDGAEFIREWEMVKAKLQAEEAKG